MDYGFLELVKGFRAKLRGLPVLSVPHFDIIIFVSPEYRIDYVREFIDKSKPKVWYSQRCGKSQRCGTAKGAGRVKGVGQPKVWEESKVWKSGARCGSVGGVGSGDAVRHFVSLCARFETVGCAKPCCPADSPHTGHCASPGHLACSSPRQLLLP